MATGLAIVTPSQVRYAPLGIEIPQCVLPAQTTMSDLLFVAVLCWIASGIVGAVIGTRRNSAGAGFVLGLFFGPLGALAAFALDGRSACPECRNKIDNGVRLCPTCHARLDWYYGIVGTVDTVAQWREQRQQRIQAEHVADQRSRKQAAKRHAEFKKNVLGVFGFAWALLWSCCQSLLRVLLSPFVALDRWLFSIADGSPATYRGLWIGSFVLIPLTFVAGCGVIVWASQTPESPVTAQPAGNAKMRPVVAEMPPAPNDEKPPKDEAGAAGKEAFRLPGEPEDRPAPRLPGAAALPRINEPAANAADARPVAIQTQDYEIEASVPGDHDQLVPARANEGPAPAVPRPVAIDGGEINRQAAEARERADRKTKIRSLEREIQELAKKRVAAHQEAKEAAMEASAGIRIFGRNSPSYYMEQGDKLLPEIRRLRAQLNELQRQDSRPPTPLAPVVAHVADPARPAAAQAPRDEIEVPAIADRENPAPARPNKVATPEAPAAASPDKLDGGDIDRRAVEARERADRKEQIRLLEREMQALAKKRAVAQQKARQAAIQSAESDALAARTGIPFARSSPHPFLEEADRILAEIHKLRDQVDQLKREDARPPTP